MAKVPHYRANTLYPNGPWYWCILEVKDSTEWYLDYRNLEEGPPTLKAMLVTHRPDPLESAFVWRVYLCPDMEVLGDYPKHSRAVKATEKHFRIRWGPTVENLNAKRREARSIGSKARLPYLDLALQEE